MKLLSLDIESRPALVWTFDLKVRGGYINPGNIKEPVRMLCFAAQWEGEEEIQFFSEWEHGLDGMASAIWKLLDQADVVMGYNSRRFDIPAINTELLLAGLKPPSPFQQIDLYQVMRRFALMAKSLKYTSQMLGTSRKLEHEGLDLWLKVMSGDEDARRRMREYNCADVAANFSLYERIKPWIPNHPNTALMAGNEFACPTCGSETLRTRGIAYTTVSAYRRYQCLSCGKWVRDAYRLSGTNVRQIAS